jgi:hypothetical protein
MKALPRFVAEQKLAALGRAVQTVRGEVGADLARPAAA